MGPNVSLIEAEELDVVIKPPNRSQAWLGLQLTASSGVGQMQETEFKHTFKNSIIILSSNTFNIGLKSNAKLEKGAGEVGL